MNSAKVKADLVLLLAAAIWGFAFVAQRVGMDYVGPFTYNGVRFSLGILVLLPFFYARLRKGEKLIYTNQHEVRRKVLIGCLITGLLLFTGVALQQLGLQKTTAGKAGFLTELYVVFVPVAGLFLGQKSNWFIWAGMVLSIAGLYFLSITSGFSLSHGDTLVLMCSFVFTFHVLIIGWLSPQMDSILLALIQFSITAALNLLVAFTIETVTLGKILEAWLPIAYGGNTLGGTGIHTADHRPENGASCLCKYYPGPGSCFCSHRGNAAAWRNHEPPHAGGLPADARRNSAGAAERRSSEINQSFSQSVNK